MDSLQQFGAVFLVLGLLGAAVLALRNKRFSGFAPNLRFDTGSRSVPKRLQILERLPLTPQHSLCLVRVGESELIVTTGPGGCQIIPSPERP